MIDVKKYISEGQDIFAILDGSEQESNFNIEKLVEDLIADYSNQTMQRHTVYIPSKGRASSHTTYNLCVEEQVPCRIVVEPQDYVEYVETIPHNHLLTLDKNDQGIQYARTWIKNYSKSQGESYHWQMDDDMKYFTMRMDDKNKRVNLLHSMSIIEQVFTIFENVAVGGMTSNAFAFSKPKPVKLNQLGYGCSIINNDFDQDWREGTVEDWDYTLRALEAKMCTMAFSHINFQTPSSGTNAGGNQLTDWASVEKRKEFYDHFASLWPKNFRVVELVEGSSKGYKLEHKRRFFNDYKNLKLILKTSLQAD